MTIHDQIQTLENANRADALLATLFAKETRYHDEPHAALKRAGFDAYRWCTKGAVDSIMAADVAVALTPLTTAMLAGVDSTSILGTLAEGAISLELGQGARIQIGTVRGRQVDEGEPKPVGRIEFDAASSDVSKIVSMVVCSTEALASLNPTAIRAIRTALQTATAEETDTYVIDALTAAAGSPTSSGAPGDLLMAISGGRPAAPAIIGDLSALLALDSGVLKDLRDLNVRVIPTPAATGKLFAVDLRGLLIADGGAEFSIARHANIWMDDMEGSPLSEPVLVSLWQKNLEAIRCERWLKLVSRSGAIAYATIES